jgi:hypothetical protein
MTRRARVARPSTERPLRGLVERRHAPPGLSRRLVVITELVDMPAINVVFIEKYKRDRTWSDILMPRLDICASARVVGDPEAR